MQRWRQRVLGSSYMHIVSALQVVAVVVALYLTLKSISQRPSMLLKRHKPVSAR